VDAIWKKSSQELDLKGTLGYVQGLYYMSAFNKSLFASTFGESYRNKRRHGVEFMRNSTSFRRGTIPGVCGGRQSGPERPDLRKLQPGLRLEGFLPPRRAPGL